MRTTLAAFGIVATTVIMPVATAAPAQAHISKCDPIFTGSVYSIGGRELRVRVSRSCPSTGHHNNVQVKAQVMRKVVRWGPLPDTWTPTDSIFTGTKTKRYSSVTAQGYCTPNAKTKGNVYRVDAVSLVTGPHGDRKESRKGPESRINCR